MQNYTTTNANLTTQQTKCKRTYYQMGVRWGKTIAGTVVGTVTGIIGGVVGLVFGAFMNDEEMDDD